MRLCGVLNIFLQIKGVLSFCDLHDLGFYGLSLTWDNGRSEWS
jgi:hypothetical protein